MGWYSGVHDGTAGKFIDVVDTYLVANHSTWTVYDSGFATNEKVYRCYDATKTPPYLFYLHVQDNQANYTIVKMYGNWNAGTHAWVDDAAQCTYTDNAGYPTWISKRSTGWQLRTHNHHFIYVDTTAGAGHWVGFVVPLQPARNQKLMVPCGMVVASNNYNSNYNPLGICINWQGISSMRFLQSSTGETNVWGGVYGNGADCGNLGIGNLLYIRESILYASSPSQSTVEGRIPGVCVLRNASSQFPTGIVNGDSVWVENLTNGGVDEWIFYKGITVGYGCLIQKNY